MTSLETLLSSCDREPIHVPGSIQPHGALLSCRDGPDLTVVRASANLARFLAVDAAGALGRPLAAVLDAAEDIHGLAMHARAGGTHHLRLPPVGGRGWLDVACHRAGQEIVLELEPFAPEMSPEDVALPLIQEAAAQIQRADSPAAVARTAVDVVRRLSGFGQVMLYRFLADGSGEVIAEACGEVMPSYLGLRFPASDIPRQARELYRRSWLRCIPDARYEPVPLLAAEPQVTQVPLDLSDAALRSVSPVHLQYLANMGMRASMSISLIQRGELWGLIACHHLEPRLPPAHLRRAAETFGQLISLQLEAREAVERYGRQLAAKRTQDKLLGLLDGGGAIGDQLAGVLPVLADVVRADGIAVGHEGQVHRHGTTPAEADVLSLAASLGARAPDTVLATSSLAAEHPPAASFADLASGALWLPLDERPDDFIIWFRRELVHVVTWGGDPRKPVEEVSGQLTPRQSFAAWQETVRHQAEPWEAQEVEAALSLRTALDDLAQRQQRLAEKERQEAQAKHRQMIAELDQRVRKTLSLIRSLIVQTQAHAASLETFAMTLEGRIRALAHAHDLLSEQEWRGTALRRMLAVESAPFAGIRAGSIELTGGEMALRPTATIALIMVLHELLSNAARHGALSAGAGKVEVNASLSGNGDLALGWRERGGPSVRPPERTSFGTSLIEQTIKAELGGEAELRFGSKGFEADLLIPAHHLCLDLPAAREGQARLPTAPVHRRVLLVEDQLIVALDLEGMVQQLGYEPVGPASSLEEAAECVARGGFELAILDINLNDRYVFPIAEELRRLSVPFLFATGYGQRDIIPAELRNVPIMTKPYDLGLVRRMLGELDQTLG